MADKTLDDVVTAVNEQTNTHEETNLKLGEIKTVLDNIKTEVRSIHLHCDHHCDCDHEGD